MKNKLLSKEKYFNLIDKYFKKNYWKNHENRWQYHEIAINIVKKIKPKSVLEAGVRGVKIFESSDTIDVESKATPTYLHDLSVIPYPINKRYDIFIALRVFHHVKGDLTNCFDEIKKITNHIIIAVPAGEVKGIQKGISWNAFTLDKPEIFYCNKIDTNIYYWDYGI